MHNRELPARLVMKQDFAVFGDLKFTFNNAVHDKTAKGTILILILWTAQLFSTDHGPAKVFIEVDLLAQQVHFASIFP